MPNGAALAPIVAKQACRAVGFREDDIQIAIGIVIRHGADERLGLEGFSFGVRLIYEVLWEVAAP